MRCRDYRRVGPSVDRSERPSVRNQLFFRLTRSGLCRVYGLVLLFLAVKIDVLRPPSVVIGLDVLFNLFMARVFKQSDANDVVATEELGFCLTFLRLCLPLVLIC